MCLANDGGWLKIIAYDLQLSNFKTTRYMENTQNKGRIPNMMCFPNLSFYDAEQRHLADSTTFK